ncbi:chromosome segregation protein SMC [Egicoccus halophilus]|uniref:Chromosome partition protein Smc n=1 Tax=Egicoccus halophilus TaxID=1670830 RepID=A0A8J3ES41_9ACTN|nr:chromosome segregation protein SMC [Egicoccus halophilus]GGI06462.1 chromosome partition protein Smc [Egicoccus halophilus]
MFLRSLTMRGFKSFADKTLLEVEPGITVIVGPNGSGKSNVVDALAWVLGTHSAKKVRGGSMSDVIFAGSPTRNRANQARVEIVIDNADGRLSGAGLGTAASAAEFSEVRVARTIHADGDAAYQINGQDVRALDVQELLSDTGLGRELHTIVGQGQLDEILNAKPEERRRYIEEAAGILKHRRRRERALRKLDQVDGHIDKLRTVLRELRRQLRPLERQAEAADRYAQLQAELRDVKVRRAARELDRLTRLAASEATDDGETTTALQQADRQLATLRERQGGLERELARLGPAAEQAQRTYYRLTSLQERLKGTSDLVEAKRRHLVEYAEEPLAGRPPAELRAQAERLEAQRVERGRDRDADRQRFEAAAAARREAEQARRAHEQAVQAQRRRRAEQRERVLRWEGEVSALRGAVASAEGELGRVASTLDGLDTRVAEAEAEVATVQGEVQQLDVSEVALTDTLEAAEHEVAEAQQVVDDLVTRLREVDARRSSQAARAEALRAALAETGGGTAALLAAGLDGLLGHLADHVRVEGGNDAALAAALGALGEAVVVRTGQDAADAVAWLRAAAPGPATVLAARAPRAPRDTGPARRQRLHDAGAEAVSDLLAPAAGVEDAETVVDALRQVLADTWMVPDWHLAVRLHGDEPALTFVTPEGDVAGPAGFRGGASPERSAVVTATAADDAERDAAASAAELDELRGQRDGAERRLREARGRLAAATERINESDAAITGAAERLARLHKELDALASQRAVVAGQREELATVLERDRAALSELHGRGPDAELDDEELDEGPDETAIELDDRVELARERELEARVHLERTTEQVRHLELQAQGLRAEADEVEAELAEAARRRELRRQAIVRCGELALVARTATEALTRAVQSAAAERDRVQAELGRARSQLGQVRDEAGRAAKALEVLRERRHAAELRRAEVTNRLQQLTDRLRGEFSLSPAEVRAEHPDAVSYDEAALAEREDVLVRKLGLLGRVNPLALEEFKALEERHAFLSDQLDDLRRSKKDLEEVVVAVDDRIRAVFREAFDDIAREFQLTFATVFPGGHGRLVLTEPDDLLVTGIEVEARPPGKKVTRLSLLSGGERSLTVLAFVFAIFRARPSPFYVLDEVDAALDDVNLQRLLRVVRSFRGHAQIIMVTHQKRSMEIADVLYGVTMGPDAVTKVVAERLRDQAAVEALEQRASAAPTQAVQDGPAAEPGRPETVGEPVGG